MTRLYADVSQHARPAHCRLTSDETGRERRGMTIQIKAVNTLVRRYITMHCTRGYSASTQRVYGDVVLPVTLG